MSDTIIRCWCQRETPRAKTCERCERAAMPDRTTAEALLAAVDEAHNDHLAHDLASHYLAHRNVLR